MLRLREKILRANIEVYRKEACLYEVLHVEIFNKVEQTRLKHKLKYVVQGLKKIGTVKIKALDIGCGTGNIIEKLVKWDSECIGLDLSREMIAIAKRSLKGVSTVNFVIADAQKLPFRHDSFDLVCCYSVLHHIPDYQAALEEMIHTLKENGIPFLDHEAINSYVSSLAHTLLYNLYRKTTSILNRVYFKMKRVRRPMINYTFSDYHAGRINWLALEKTLKQYGFSVQKERYLLHNSIIFNPLYPLLNRFIHDVQLLIAKKQKRAQKFGNVGIKP